MEAPTHALIGGISMNGLADEADLRLLSLAKTVSGSLDGCP